MPSEINRQLTQSGIRQSTLDYLKSIKEDINKLEDKVNDLEIKFVRLSGQLDIILPSIITQDKVESLFAKHAEDCTKKMPIRPSALPVVKKNDSTKLIAKITAAIVGLTGAIWGLIQAMK